MQIALCSAVILHLLLALLLPNIPPLVIPSIDRGQALSVFLRSAPEPEEFEQSLNNPGLFSDEFAERPAI